MVHPTAIVHANARIGAGCEIGPYCVIGEHVVLGEGCKLHSHVVVDGHTTLGRENEIFPFASIGLRTQDLKWKGGMTRTVVGGLAAVHQFCRIGRMAIIGGCSKVVQDVPPFMLADGNPAETRTINKVGMERNGVSEEAQSALRQAFKILFREGLTIPNALARIEKELPPLPEVQHLVKFARESQRGISK